LFAGNSGKSLKDMLSETNIPDEEICVYIEESIVDKNYVHPEINELITLSKNNMLSIGG
jgi:sulfur carrier protein ThiS